MTETQDIRRLPGGSIDIAHYTRKARALHAAAVRRSVRRVPGALTWLFAISVWAIYRSSKPSRVPVAVAAE